MLTLRTTLPATTANPETTFLLQSIASMADGDFPGWISADMLAWLPESIQEQFGETRESVIEENKDGYYRELRQTQRTIRTDKPDWAPWLVFFLRALQKQKDRLAKKIERERLVLGDLPDLSVKILEFYRQHGRITVAEAVKLTGANRNTIKDHVSALARAGHVTKHGAGRGTWYGLS